MGKNDLLGPRERLSHVGDGPGFGFRWGSYQDVGKIFSYDKEGRPLGEAGQNLDSTANVTRTWFEYNTYDAAGRVDTWEGVRFDVKGEEEGSWNKRFSYNADGWLTLKKGEKSDSHGERRAVG